MAELSGVMHISPGMVDTAFTNEEIPLGSRMQDSEGNEFVFLEAGAATDAGEWVSFDENYETALLAGNAVGQVAIAMADLADGEYGFHQIYGVNTIAVTDTVAANAQLFIDGTAGRADDAVVAGDMIFGAMSMTADTSNVATVRLVYPYVSNVLTA